MAKITINKPTGKGSTVGGGKIDDSGLKVPPAPDVSKKQPAPAKKGK